MKKYMNNENGRSMIEMLGVLAIIGVLSIAGIAGYSKAMGKYKINKAMDQVATLAANIKTMFASSGSYTDLATTPNALLYNLNLFPEDMIKGCSAVADVKEDNTTCVKNGVNGASYVSSTAVSGAYPNFSITFEGLSKEACVAMATADWGGASGFRGLTFGAAGSVAPGASAEAALASASANCADNSSMVWTFY